uniref:Signal recognition particle 19 kDa protein n=1 Tax=Trichuris muris TaxID=70415 RepID=A0A5S6QPK7_TRIMR
MSHLYENALPSDEIKWISIYPAYLNSKKSLAEGRRVPVAKAVENPTCNEIAEILKNIHFNVKIEKKMYPRDQNRDWQFQGRVRLQLRNTDGSLVNPSLPNRHSVFLYVCSMIPKLKTRQGRGAVPGPANDATSVAQTGPRNVHKKKR